MMQTTLELACDKCPFKATGRTEGELADQMVKHKYLKHDMQYKGME